MANYYVIKNGGTVATTDDQEYTSEEILIAVATNQIDKTWWCYYYNEDKKLKKMKIEKLLNKLTSQEPEVLPASEAPQAAEEQQTIQEEVQQTPEITETSQKEVLDAPEVQQTSEVVEATQEEVQKATEVQQTPKKETYKDKVNKLIECIKNAYNDFIDFVKTWVLKVTLVTSLVVSVGLGVYIWVLHYNVEKEIKMRDEVNTSLIRLNLDYEDRIKSLKSDNADYENQIKSMNSDIEQLKEQAAQATQAAQEAQAAQAAMNVPVYSGKTPMSDEISQTRRNEFLNAHQEYLESCEKKWYLTESWQLSKRAEALAKWGSAYERLFIYADAKASKDMNKKDYASLYSLYVASAIYTGHMNNPNVGLEDGIKMVETKRDSVKDFILNLDLQQHHREAIEML